MVWWTHLSVRKHLLQGEGQEVFVLDYLPSNRRPWKVSCEKQFHIRSKAATVKTGSAASIKDKNKEVWALPAGGTRSVLVCCTVCVYAWGLLRNYVGHHGCCRQGLQHTSMLTAHTLSTFTPMGLWKRACCIKDWHPHHLWLCGFRDEMKGIHGTQ